MPITLTDSKQNKLALVNRCLQAIGEAPLPGGSIPSEFPLGSDTQVASSIVDDTWIEVCNRGWWFNTDLNFTLTPDSNNFIALPETVLRIDTVNGYGRYIKRQGMVYDRYEHTFTFEDTIKLSLIWATNYSDLPVAAYEYIATRSARKFQQKVIGAPDLERPLLQEEADALQNLQRENIQYLDSSMLEPSVSNRYINIRSI